MTTSQPRSPTWCCARGCGRWWHAAQIARRGQRVAVGPLRIDAVALEASYAGQPLALPRLEFALLHQLAREPRRVFTRDELLAQVWGYPPTRGRAASADFVNGIADPILEALQRDGEL
jgi:two-component system, OmpR family, response regulator MtrA